MPDFLSALQKLQQAIFAQTAGTPNGDQYLAIGNVLTGDPFDDGIASHIALAYPVAGTATPAAAATTATIDLLPQVTGKLTMQGFPSMLDARHVQLFVDNHGTGQTITAAQLQSATTVGTSTSTKTYSPTAAVSIANNVGAYLDIPTPNGLEAGQLNVVLTWGSGVTGGTVITVQAKIFTQPVTSGAFTDRSGSIATGGTAQNAVNANTARRYLFVKNSGTSNIWFSLDTVATQNSPSIGPLAPGDWYEESLPGFVPTGSLSIVGPTTSQFFTIKEA